MGSKKSNTYSNYILARLEEMQVDEKFSKKKFILQHRFRYDFYMDRSFCVLFVKAKQQLKGRTFKCIKGQITRIT